MYVGCNALFHATRILAIPFDSYVLYMQVILSPSPSETYYAALDPSAHLSVAAAASLPLLSSSRQQLFSLMANTLSADGVAQHARSFGHVSEQLVLTSSGGLSVQPVDDTVFCFAGTAWARLGVVEASDTPLRSGVILSKGVPPNTANRRRLLSVPDGSRRRLLALPTRRTSELAGAYQSAMTAVLSRLLPPSASLAVLCSGPVFGAVCGMLAKSRPQTTMALVKAAPLDTGAGSNIVPLRNALDRTVVAQLYRSQQLFGLSLLGAEVLSTLADTAGDHRFLVALGRCRAPCVVVSRNARPFACIVQCSQKHEAWFCTVVVSSRSNLTYYS